MAGAPAIQAEDTVEAPKPVAATPDATAGADQGPALAQDGGATGEGTVKDPASSGVTTSGSTPVEGSATGTTAPGSGPAPSAPPTGSTPGDAPGGATEGQGPGNPHAPEPKGD